MITKNFRIRSLTPNFKIRNEKKAGCPYELTSEISISYNTTAFNTYRFNCQTPSATKELPLSHFSALQKNPPTLEVSNDNKVYNFSYNQVSKTPQKKFKQFEPVLSSHTSKPSLKENKPIRIKVFISKKKKNLVVV